MPVTHLLTRSSLVTQRKHKAHLMFLWKAQWGHWLIVSQPNLFFTTCWILISPVLSYAWNYKSLCILFCLKSFLSFFFLCKDDLSVSVRGFGQVVSTGSWACTHVAVALSQPYHFSCSFVRLQWLNEVLVMNSLFTGMFCFLCDMYGMWLVCVLVSMQNYSDGFGSGTDPVNSDRGSHCAW